MKRKILICCCVLPLQLWAQSLTLEACKQRAEANYPAVSQYRLIELTRDFTLENAAKAWLPQVSASVSGVAFTDLLDVNDRMKRLGIDTKTTMASGMVMVNQNVYDGGQIHAQRQIARAQADVQHQQLAVSMYDLNRRVEQLYFGVLLLDAQIKHTQLLQEDLSLSRKTVEAMQKGGIANQSDVDAVAVEQENALQLLDAQQASRLAYLRMLGLFIHQSLGNDVQLQMPVALELKTREVYRPELSYYQARESLLEAQRKQLNSRLFPTLKAFGMGVYHTKVTDLMKNGMLAGGLTLSWNIGALYTRKNDLRKLDVERQQVESERATFLFNNRLEVESTEGNIAMLKKQLVRDDEIVRLREQIRDKSEKKVRLGTESVNEMLRDINAVSKARQQRSTHEIQLIEALYALKTKINQ
ncbi:MAG: TolC family protein [Segatella oris]|uniref:TolC family protein n=1 Tax=Segatella oris TaxID=28135 RepID=UPI003FA29386